jgi:hypothetical protein
MAGEDYPCPLLNHITLFLLVTGWAESGGLLSPGFL